MVIQQCKPTNRSVAWVQPRGSRYPGSGKCLMDALVKRTQRAVELKTRKQLTAGEKAKLPVKGKPYLLPL